LLKREGQLLAKDRKDKFWQSGQVAVTERRNGRLEPSNQLTAKEKRQLYILGTARNERGAEESKLLKPAPVSAVHDYNVMSSSGTRKRNSISHVKWGTLYVSGMPEVN
jgi:hypothetical protein